MMATVFELMYYNDSDKMALFKIRLSDYFGGDVNEVSLDVSGFQWDGVNIVGAGCILTFEGPSPGNGKFRTLTGVVNVDESGELEFVEGEYY